MTTEADNLVISPGRMAEKQIYLTPTLACYGIMVRPPFEHFLPESGQAKNREVMSKGLQALKIAEDAGVTVCYGSDLLTSVRQHSLRRIWKSNTVGMILMFSPFLPS